MRTIQDEFLIKPHCTGFHLGYTKLNHSSAESSLDLPGWVAALTEVCMHTIVNHNDSWRASICWKEYTFPQEKNARLRFIDISERKIWNVMPLRMPTAT